MSWEEYADLAGITDPGFIEKMNRLYPGGTDEAPDSVFNSLGRNRDGNPVDPTDDTNVDNVVGPDGNNTPFNQPDVLPEDRQQWLDFIAPARQTWQQFLDTGGIITPAEEGIRQGVTSATERLKEQMARTGNTSGGAQHAMQSAIERGGIGETAASRARGLDLGARGMGQLGQTWASLLHQQRPVPMFGSQWSSQRYDRDGNPIPESTEGDYPQWDPYSD